MKRVNELLSAMLPMKEEVRKRCLAYLKRQLKKHTRLDFYDEDGDAIGDEFITVSYDGGRHPEYASSCFNMVNAVYMSNGKILLDTEEDEEYDIQNITLDELVTIAEYVCNVVIPSLKK